MKKTILLILTAIFVLASATIVFAGTWEQDANGWKWKQDNGTYAKNGWQWIDSNNDGTSECYYFDTNGYCLQNTTTPDGYQVNADGAWIKDGKVQTQTTSSNTAQSTGTSSVAGTYNLYAVRVQNSTFTANSVNMTGSIDLRSDGTSSWRYNNISADHGRWGFSNNRVWFVDFTAAQSFDYYNGVIIHSMGNLGTCYYAKQGADTSWIGAKNR